MWPVPLFQRIIWALFVFMFLLPSISHAQTPSTPIVVNEFAIEPEQSIELYNPSSDTVDLSGWYLDDDGGSKSYFTIPLGTTLYPFSCLVFEENVNLNKASSDSLRLFDNTAPPDNANAVLIDSYTYPNSPGVGISFSRNPDGLDSWEESTSSFRRLNATGEYCEVVPTPTPSPTFTPTPTPSPTPTQTPSPTPTQVPVSYNNILITEAYVAPNSGESEWVELYNNNDFEVELSKWSLDDISNGGSAPVTFTLVIPAKQYKVVDLSSSIFNNSGDSVRILDQNTVEKYTFTYTYSQKGISWGRKSIELASYCLQNPSKGSVNTDCIETESFESTDELIEELEQQYFDSEERKQIEPKTSSYSPKQYFFPLESNQTETYVPIQKKESSNQPMLQSDPKSKSDLSFPQKLAGLYSLLSLAGVSAKIVLSRSFVI